MFICHCVEILKFTAADGISRLLPNWCITFVCERKSGGCVCHNQHHTAHTSLPPPCATVSAARAIAALLSTYVYGLNVQCSELIRQKRTPMLNPDVGVCLYVSVFFSLTTCYLVDINMCIRQLLPAVNRHSLSMWNYYFSLKGTRVYIPTLINWTVFGLYTKIENTVPPASHCLRSLWKEKENPESCNKNMYLYSDYLNFIIDVCWRYSCNSLV